MNVLRRTLFFGACVMHLAAAVASAQTVAVQGGEKLPAVRTLRSILAGDYLLLTSDTTLPATFRHPGNLVVLGAEVRLEGEVAGNVGVVNGALFVRPRARIGGTVAVVGGELIASGLAEVGAVQEAPLSTTVTLGAEPERVRVTVVPPPPPARLELPGTFGLLSPRYDRVDGLSLTYTPRFNLTRSDSGAFVVPRLVYHSARGDLDGGVLLDLPVARGYRAVAEVATETVTNDRWIRGDFVNTLTSLAFRDDQRNYYHADRVTASVARVSGEPVLQGELFWAPFLTLLASRDRSLRASDPWSLLGDDWRDNPPVREATIASATAGTRLRWNGRSSAFVGAGSVEFAPPGVSDVSFAQAVFDGLWSMQALWTHTIDVRLHAMAPLGGGAPPQRWSFVGGSTTLPTLGVADRRGDHVYFVESVYVVPLPQVELPVIGSPSFEAVHKIGNAWISGEDAPAWVQNVGVGVRVLRFVQVRVLVDPAGSPLEPAFGISVGLP